MTTENAELVGPEKRYLPNPMTGTAIDIKGPDEDLAEALDEIRQMELRLKSTKRVVSDEVLRRMDKDRNWSREAGAYKMIGRSPELKDYDGDALATVLEEYVKAGEISKDAAEAALKVVVEYKAQKRGVNALLKGGGELAERVKACETLIEKPRYVRVEK